MSPTKSNENRPLFICPNWVAVAPLLAHSIASNDQDIAQTARFELLTLCRAMDEWKKRAPEFSWLLYRALDNLDEAATTAARSNITEALSLLGKLP